jgi:parallel beta-helix repeat protein
VTFPLIAARVEVCSLLAAALALPLVTCSQSGPLASSDSAIAGEVEIFPGESIQAAVDANPGNTTFVLKSGTHRRQRVVPKSGNTFTGEPGTVLDGENSTEFAFRGTADNVTIRNVTVTRYTPGVHHGAIRGLRREHWGDEAIGWVVEDCEVSYSDGAGITIADEGVVRRCHIHHNGQMGITGWPENGLIEDNEVSYNNTGGYDPNWEAGGMKLFYSDGLVIRNNHVHHNHGSTGIWLDFNLTNCLIEGNLVEHNGTGGILYEISYSGTIRNNTVRRNGSWGIVVSTSSGVEVYDNSVIDNGHGILAIHNDRGSGDYGAFILKDLWVHDNTVTLPQGAFTGILDDTGGTAAYTSYNNRFDRNTYNAVGAFPFWGTQSDGSWSAWQAAGRDRNGTFN